ncbi:MAG: SagB/ThcOx family dehydrogenase [Planctomycetota bacterium]|nr:SagB/ThcOx family dehydrogenase [Planctomycetota bacterium]
MPDIEQCREFLRNHLWKQWQTLETDQRKNKPQPALQKALPPDAKLIDLVAPQDLTLGQMPLMEALQRRESRREYNEKPLTLEELSFLLWSTQGVREVISEGQVVLRTVPSAGARHPFETYLLVNRVAGLERGVYRYLALEHKLCWLASYASRAKAAEAACPGFVGDGAVVFIWSVIPYRTEWRYGVISPKLIALDAGHVCQNLYLACEAIGAATCAVGAYDQDAMDELIDVDGLEEFTIYIAPVGKVR